MSNNTSVTIIVCALISGCIGEGFMVRSHQLEMKKIELEIEKAKTANHLAEKNQ